MPLGCVERGIVLGLPNAGQRGLESLRAEPLPQQPEGVDHPGQAGVATEEDQASALLIGNGLVVQEVAGKVHEPFQHGHVVGLALDGVGEEEVGAAFPEYLLGHLFDPDDHVAGGEILAYGGSGPLIVFVGEDPDG
jgi:hypothetical protein